MYLDVLLNCRTFTIIIFYEYMCVYLKKNIVVVMRIKFFFNATFGYFRINLIKKNTLLL